MDTPASVKRTLFEDDEDDRMSVSTEREHGEGSSSKVNGKLRSRRVAAKGKLAELFRKDLISAMKLPDTEQLQPEDYVLVSDTWRQEWEKGVQVPINPQSILDPSVWKIPGREKVYGMYGFKIPRKYLHATKDENFQQGVHELHETQKLAEQVCRYDLDYLDVSWLQLINQERLNMGDLPIEEWVMEKVIEEMETQCHSNMKTMIKTVEGLGIEYDENILCDVCKSPESEDTNEMVFCDGCDICVHQACYGISKIPAGSWLCRLCVLGMRPKCILCPWSGGAMKSTKSGTKWAHVSCALWIPEVSIGCPEKMEPITKISQIPSSRWSLLCNLCRERSGACVQCCVKTCKTAFHVTCGFKHNLEMRTTLDHDGEDVKLQGYCVKHSKRLQEKETGCCRKDCGVESPRKELTEAEKTELRSHRLQKLAEEFNTCVHVEEVAAGLQVPEETVNFIYSYWTLKRKSNFNKPLLTPKTEEADLLCKQREDSLVARLKMFVHLRQDLERVRNLCYMVTRREKLRRQLYKMKEEVFKAQLAVLKKTPAKLLGVRDHKFLVTAHMSDDVLYDQYDHILSCAERGFPENSELVVQAINKARESENPKKGTKGRTLKANLDHTSAGLVEASKIRGRRDTKEDTDASVSSPGNQSTSDVKSTIVSPASATGKSTPKFSGDSISKVDLASSMVLTSRGRMAKRFNLSKPGETKIPGSESDTNSVVSHASKEPTISRLVSQQNRRTKRSSRGASKSTTDVLEDDHINVTSLSEEESLNRHTRKPAASSKPKKFLRKKYHKKYQKKFQHKYQKKRPNPVINKSSKHRTKLKTHSAVRNRKVKVESSVEVKAKRRTDKVPEVKAKVKTEDSTELQTKVKTENSSEPMTNVKTNNMEQSSLGDISMDSQSDSDTPRRSLRGGSNGLIQNKKFVVGQSIKEKVQSKLHKVRLKSNMTNGVQEAVEKVKREALLESSSNCNSQSVEFIEATTPVKSELKKDLLTPDSKRTRDNEIKQNLISLSPTGLLGGYKIPKKSPDSQSRVDVEHRTPLGKRPMVEDTSQCESPETRSVRRRIDNELETDCDQLYENVDGEISLRSSRSTTPDRELGPARKSSRHSLPRQVAKKLKKEFLSIKHSGDEVSASNVSLSNSDMELDSESECGFSEANSVSSASTLNRPPSEQENSQSSTSSDSKQSSRSRLSDQWSTRSLRSVSS